MQLVFLLNDPTHRLCITLLLWRLDKNNYCSIQSNNNNNNNYNITSTLMWIQQYSSVITKTSHWYYGSLSLLSVVIIHLTWFLLSYWTNLKTKVSSILKYDRYVINNGCVLRNRKDSCVFINANIADTNIFRPIN